MENSDFSEPAGETTYMASQAADKSTREMLAQALHPGLFKVGDDVDLFIDKCTRYFNGVNIPKTLRQTLVIGLIVPSAREQYETVDEKISDFEERMRKAFSRPKSRSRDMKELLRYERTTENVKMFVKKVDTLIDRVLAHEWTKEELRKEMLLLCNNEEDTRRMVTIQKVDTSEGMIEILETMEKVKRDTEQVNAVKSFSEIVKGKPESRPNFNRTKGEGTGRSRQDGMEKEERRRCYNCDKSGHISRFCDQPRKRNCYVCGSGGHLARYCEKNYCTDCGRDGHTKERCFRNQRPPVNMGQRYRGGAFNERQNNGGTREFDMARNYNNRQGYMEGRRNYNNEYSRSYNNYGHRGMNNRYVNTMGEDDYNEADDRARYSKADERVRYQDRREEEPNPNGEAPSKVELIGALC